MSGQGCKLERRWSETQRHGASHTQRPRAFRERETERDKERHSERGDAERRRQTKRQEKVEEDPRAEPNSPNSQMKANSCVQLSEATHLKEGSLPM